MNESNLKAIELAIDDLAAVEAYFYGKAVACPVGSEIRATYTTVVEHLHATKLELMDTLLVVATCV